MARSVSEIETALSLKPFKSLMKIKTLMSSPRFNVRRYKSNTQYQFLIWGNEQYTDRFFLMKLENGIFPAPSRNIFMQLQQPALPLYSTNGIILMSIPDGDDHHLSLINPTASSFEFRILSQHKSEDSSINYGHYYDSGDSDYKVVIISRKRFGEEEYSIFSCRNKIWSKKLLINLHTNEAIKHEKGVFVDGCFYWWLCGDRKLLGFDVRDGKAHFSPGPRELSGMQEVDHKIKLTELTGRLCMYRKKKGKGWLDLQVWVMEKYNDFVYDDVDVVDDDDGADSDSYTNVDGDHNYNTDIGTGVVVDPDAPYDSDDIHDVSRNCFGDWVMLMRFHGYEQMVKITALDLKDYVVCFVNETLSSSRFFSFEDEEEYRQIDCMVNSQPMFHHVIPFSTSLYLPNS